MSVRTEGTAAKERSEGGGGRISGENAWLDAHHDPVASLYTFSSCMALEDINKDGDYKLLIGDLGSGEFDMKLKMYKGTELAFETPLLDLPAGVATFYMDVTDPRTPAIAVAAGSSVYVYKNLRPYFKFSLPYLQLNPAESDLWNRVKEDKLDAAGLHKTLSSLYEKGCEIPLTVRSLKFIHLEEEDLDSFVSIFKHVPLKRQTVLTALATMHKSHPEQDAVSCLVVGTENKDLYILDPEAFTVLKHLHAPATPVFLAVTGLYDVEYQLTVACRDNCIYIFKSGSTTPRYKIALTSQPVGLQTIGKEVIVGCMDNYLGSYTRKGKNVWNILLPASITCVELLHYQSRSFKAVLVALRNKEVRIYKDKFLVNIIKMEDIVVGMKFGTFGRENGVLLLVTQGGALSIKILRRSVNFEVKEAHPGPPRSQLSKLNIPKRTKVYIDQMMREKEIGTAMHNIFQRDLCRLQLEITRAYAKAVTSSLAPLTSTPHFSLKIAAQVQGLGPLFRLTVTVQNTSPSTSISDHYITFRCDQDLYIIRRKFIEMPLLVPALTYSFDTMVECTDDHGRAEDIFVHVVKTGNPIPLITAVINMPVSENIIVT